jgi:hypothetical protein
VVLKGLLLSSELLDRDFLLWLSRQAAAKHFGKVGSTAESRPEKTINKQPNWCRSLTFILFLF